MEIVVCVKRVAATDSTIKVGSDGRSIDPAGVEFVLNPYDEIALEQALRTKEEQGSGTVTAVTLGPAAAQKELRTCLAIGADKAVLLKTEGWVHDSYSAAEALAKYIAAIPHDLVFTGKQAVDSDNSQLAQRLAVLLKLPCVTEVSSLALSAGIYTAEKDIEGAREIVRCPVPAVISCNKGLNEPRYANLKGIMAAKKKPLEEVDAELVEPATKIVSVTLPPARPPGKILGEGVDAVTALIDVLKTEAKIL
jgi:electron transfer flavoprotein beta subunit